MQLEKNVSGCSWRKAFRIYCLVVVSFILLATLCKFIGGKGELIRAVLIWPGFAFFLKANLKLYTIYSQVWNFPRDTIAHTYLIACVYFPILFLLLLIGFRYRKWYWFAGQIFLIVAALAYFVYDYVTLFGDGLGSFCK